MAKVTMPPVEEARSIFTRLGYTVSGDGPEFRAERKWRTVHITAVDTDTEAADCVGNDDEDFRCFVTWKEAIDDLHEYLERVNPSYEWAIIGVEEDDEYDVVRADGGAV